MHALNHYAVRIATSTQCPLRRDHPLQVSPHLSDDEVAPAALPLSADDVGDANDNTARSWRLYITQELDDISATDIVAASRHTIPQIANTAARNMVWECAKIPMQIAACDHLDERTRSRAAKLVMMIPAILLTHITAHNESLMSGIRRRCRQFMDDGWQTLWRDLCDYQQHARNSHTVGDDRRVHRAMRHVALGEIRKARSVLSSTPPVAVTDEVDAELRRLHPLAVDEDDVAQIFANNPPRRVAPGDSFLQRAVDRANRGSSPGAGGWRFKFIQQMCASGYTNLVIDFLKAIATGACLVGDAETLQLFTGATLVPYRKPNGKIRPIAIACSWRRIVGKAWLLQLRHITNSQLVKHRQYAMARGGSTVVSHLIRALRQQSSGEVLLSVDISNAFNCFHRRAMLRYVARLCPDLLCWLQLTYGSPTPLWLRGRQSLLSSRGSQQGDTLGTLLFCLALNPVLASVTAAFPQTEGAHFADDLNWRVPAEAVPQFLSTLQQQLHTIGLDLSAEKSSLLCTSRDDVLRLHRACAAEYASPLLDTDESGRMTSVDNIPVLCAEAGDGVKILNVPHGSAAYTRRHLIAVHQATSDLADKCRQLSHLQSRWLMLSVSVLPRVTYWLRALVPSATLQLAQEHDRLLAAEIGVICDSGMPDDIAQAILTMRMADGGLGLRDMTSARHGLFVTALLQSLDSARTSAPTCLDALKSSDYCEEMLATCSNVLSEMVTPDTLRLLPQHAGDLDDTTSAHKLQKRVTRDVDRWRWNRTARVIGRSVSAAVATRHLFAIASHRGKHESLFLRCTPDRKELRFSNVNFRDILRDRLCMSLILRNQLPEVCSGADCSIELDAYGDHVKTFMHKCQGQSRKSLHDDVLLVLQEVLAMSGVSTRREVPYAGSRDGDEVAFRIDLVATNARYRENGRRGMVWFDLTFASPFAQGASSVGRIEADRTAADEAAARKHRKYDDLAAEYEASVVPLAFDLGGRMAVETRKALQVLCQTGQSEARMRCGVRHAHLPLEILSCAMQSMQMRFVRSRVVALMDRARDNSE